MTNVLSPRRKKDRIDALAKAAASEDAGVSLTREAFRRLRRSPTAIAGAIIIVLFILVALLGDLIAPKDPLEQNLELIRPGEIPGGSPEHPLGVDGLGRDELSRLIVGARQSLLVGVVATMLGFAIGAVIGGVSGALYGQGRWGSTVDNVLMRFMDMLLAMPSLLVAVTVAALLSPSLTTVMIAVGVVTIPIFARLLRGSMIAQSNRDYVLASTSLGVKRNKIVLSHIIPNSLAPILVQATLTLATAIIDAAALSYLGLGNPDQAIPEWGTMLADAQRYLSVRPELAVYPAMAIIVTALGFTLLGESMREALDPKMRR
jgi:peptide/nickel transport system permease protein